MGFGTGSAGGIPDREGVRGVPRAPGRVAFVRSGGSPLGGGVRQVCILGLRGSRSGARVSASDESEVEQMWAGVGLPVVGKPTAGPRPEPLAWSQVIGWGQGLPPCQVAHS